MNNEVKTVLVGSLMVVTMVVITQEQTASAELVNNGFQGYIPDETRRQINQALINDQIKRVMPIFE